MLDFPRVSEAPVIPTRTFSLHVIPSQYLTETCYITCFLANTEYIEIFNSVDRPDPAPVGHYGLWVGTEIEGSDQSRVPPAPRKLLSSC